MKAEGQARLEPPRNRGYASMGYCMLAVGYVESGVVGICECAAGNGLRGVTGDGRLHGGGGMRATRGPLLLRRMRAALYLGCCFAPIGDALAFCLLLCWCVAVRCPFTPGEQKGQRSLPLLMLTLCGCHCPQSLVGRYTYMHTYIYIYIYPLIYIYIYIYIWPMRALRPPPCLRPPPWGLWGASTYLLWPSRHEEDAFCVYRLVYVPPCVCTAGPTMHSARCARRGGQPPHPP